MQLLGQQPLAALAEDQAVVMVGKKFFLTQILEILETVVALDQSETLEAVVMLAPQVARLQVLHTRSPAGPLEMVVLVVMEVTGVLLVEAEMAGLVKV